MPLEADLAPCCWLCGQAEPRNRDSRFPKDHLRYGNVLDFLHDWACPVADHSFIDVVEWPQLPIRKVTFFHTNHSVFIKTLVCLTCSNGHGHASEDCNHGVDHECPWDLAARVAGGIAELLHLHLLGQAQAYPAAQTQPDESPKSTDARQRQRSHRRDWPCRACQLSKQADHPEHTRHHIDCKYPLHESIEWSCEACKRDWPSAHPNFTLEADKCRWFHGKTRIGTKRRRRHSRDPRPTASAGSSASLRTDQLLPDEADLEGAQGQQQSTASSSDALDYQHAQATARLPRQATADSHDGGKHARRDNAGI